MSTILAFAPRVGRPWAGGVFAGVVGEHHVIVGPTRDEPVDWVTAAAWATTLCAYGRSDFALPCVAELRLLAQLWPRYFSGATWWSGESHPDFDSDALVLCDAGAVHWGKQHQCLAIAVRRAPQTIRGAA